MTNQYRHRGCEAGAIDASLPVGKVVCVGRNYALHAQELGNPVLDEPIFFIKPASSLVEMESPLGIPTQWGDVHHELEIALLIGQRLCRIEANAVASAISGVGLGLDLTLRDLQTQLKADGHPWERAKAFDGSCPISCFSRMPSETDWGQLGVRMAVNGEVRQHGYADSMLTSLSSLVVKISHIFTLEPGDIVLTGTPAGVAPLRPGDRVQAELLHSDHVLVSVATSVRAVLID